MNEDDINTLRNTVREALRCSTLGDWSEEYDDADAALSSLVTIAKEARDQADGMARAPYGEFNKAVERAEQAERERDEERVRREVACIELRTRVERAERERDDAPTVRDLIGLVPDLTGSLSAEEYVRWMRDEAAEARVAELEADAEIRELDAGYRERPMEEDFYLDPKGVWVYRWRDERLVVTSSIEREIAREAEADNRAMQQEADELEARVAALELVLNNLRGLAQKEIENNRALAIPGYRKGLLARAALASPDTKEGTA